jgi:acyl-CoA dehydrogenase|tara:strand:+ start:7887 stop:8999 length:1113 start_codon:yes stop_codon:yes gene_type:complete
LNFDFSDQEKLIRDQTGRFLGDNCKSEEVRRVLEGNDSYARELWSGLANMGLMATAIPEAYGGVGGGYLGLCVIAEQLGAHLAPVPMSSSIYLAAEAITLYGDESQKETWLPKLATGETIGTLAAVETVQEMTPESINVESDGKTISGTKLIVPDGGIADIAVVLARSTDGLSMFIVDLNEGAVSRTNVDTVDPSKNSASITFNGAPAELLGEAGNGWSMLQDIYDRAAVLFAFEQIGGAQKVLDMAVDYAKQRFAFGRPIGSFQGLKHMMADMYVALKLAESNCFYAAWALANNAADLSTAAATARVSATQAFQLCSRDNIQVHGGMGFTWEVDCHLFYRRSNYLTLVLGGLSVWENRLIESLSASKAA